MKEPLIKSEKRLSGNFTELIPEFEQISEIFDKINTTYTQSRAAMGLGEKFRISGNSVEGLTIAVNPEEVSTGNINYVK
ncbi:MAG: hypothetical protein FJY65_05670 [Calditrichaeota bacterium]|nr:hypothetical protein [Calditrichota bacterium]